MIGLVLSGVTAFPLEQELKFLCENLNQKTSLHQWIHETYEAVAYSNRVYPFLAYGTDWLAFAHLVIAVVFIGPIIDPVKNIWVIQFGIIACLMVFPLAFIAGYYREIPVYWQLIDCSFGALGIAFLYPILKKIKVLETTS